MIGSAGAPLKVLLADDVAAFLELERSFFANEKVELLTACDGDAALALIRAERPALVLVDENMPGLKGHELCRLVKDDPELRDTSVVIVTASGDDASVIDRCMASGCDQYLTKPLQKAAVLRVAEKFLDTRQRRPMRMLVKLQRPPSDLSFGYTVDVSDGGILVETGEELQAGEVVDLQFFLPGSPEKIATRGRVVRVLKKDGDADAEVGFEFVQLEDAGRERIRRFVALPPDERWGSGS